MTDHYDVIVIGSGAGGGTLTHALAPTGQRILLLERGDFLPREPQNWDSRSVWVDLRYRNPGTWTDSDTGMEFTPKQHYYVGGNTKFYGAILFRFRERDFGSIQHVDGVSPAWPVDYADFELDNLYVVDSSFFCSSTAVNPTLTIIANALRVADHIAGRLATATARVEVPAHA